MSSDDPAAAFVTWGRFTAFALGLLTIVALPLFGVVYEFWSIRSDFYDWRQAADNRLDGYESRLESVHYEMLSLCQQMEALHANRDHQCLRILRDYYGSQFLLPQPSQPSEGEAILGTATATDQV